MKMQNPRNPYTNAVLKSVVAAQHLDDEWNEHLAKKERITKACEAYCDCVIRKNLLLASEAANEWGYDTHVSDLIRNENHTGRLYMRCEMSLSSKNIKATLAFILSVESRFFTAEAQKVNGKRRFSRASMESAAGADFVAHTIREFLCWAVI